jgi:hypothetical protein
MTKQKLTRADLVSAWKFEVQEVPIPEKGAEAVMYVRSFSALERSGLEKMGAQYSQTKDYAQIENFKYKLLVVAISDESGQPLFKDDEVELIKKFPAVVTDRLFEVAASLNGLDKKKSEQTEKNLESA